MIVRGEELQQNVRAPIYTDGFVPLKVLSIEETAGPYEVGESDFETGGSEMVDTYNGRWRLSSDSYYLVEFDAQVNMGNYTPIIYPSWNALQVGGVALPRIVTDGDGVPRTGYYSAHRHDVDVGAVLALLIVHASPTPLLERITRLEGVIYGDDDGTE